MPDVTPAEVASRFDDVTAVAEPPPKRTLSAARVPDWVTSPPVVLIAVPTAVTTPVPVVVEVTAAAEPPPSTMALAAKVPD